ncbi:DMT family transporter [Spirillospora sp. NPDC050679]
MTGGAAGAARGYVFVALSAAGFGLMPVLAVYAYRDGLTVPTLLFLRFAIAALIFVPFALRHAARRGTPGRAVRHLPRLLLLGGVLYTAQSALYFSSVQHITPALAAVLLYLYPALVAVAASVLARRRPSLGVVVSVAVSFAGVVLAMGDIEWRLSLIGIAEAVGAAGVYCVYILYSDRVGASVPAVDMTAFVALSAAGSFLVWGAATGELRFGFAATGWIPVAAVALASTVLAILFFFLGMALVGPTRASIGSTLEPVVSIVAATLLIGGGLSPAQILGTVLVLGGATVGMLSRRAADTGPPRGAPAAPVEGRRGKEPV